MALHAFDQLGPAGRLGFTPLVRLVSIGLAFIQRPLYRILGPAMVVAGSSMIEVAEAGVCLVGVACGPAPGATTEPLRSAYRD
jgi:hypothetical protein